MSVAILMKLFPKPFRACKMREFNRMAGGHVHYLMTIGGPLTMNIKLIGGLHGVLRYCNECDVNSPQAL